MAIEAAEYLTEVLLQVSRALRILPAVTRFGLINHLHKPAAFIGPLRSQVPIGTMRPRGFMKPTLYEENGSLC